MGTSKTRYCGCGAILPKGMRVCAPCKVSNYAKAVAAQNEAKTGAPQAEYNQIEQIAPWVPRQKPPPLMTTEQQKEIDRAVDDRLHRACGYGNGEPRRLSPAEIAELQARSGITPIDKIRKNDIAQWTSLHGRI